jgi:hypothetical protein
MSPSRWFRLPAAVLFMAGALPAAARGVFQATGIKLVEPTATSVTIWTRLTREAERASDERPLPILRVFDPKAGEALKIKDNAAYPGARVEVAYPPGADLGTIRGAAPGAAGQTRVLYRSLGSLNWSETPWRDVDAQRDFTVTFSLAGLRPATRYEVVVEGRSEQGAPVSSTVAGGFVTAPAPRLRPA